MDRNAGDPGRVARTTYRRAGPRRAGPRRAGPGSHGRRVHGAADRLHGGSDRTISPFAAYRRRPDPVGGRPDRVALWAVIMAVFTALVAATSARADDLQSGGAAPPGSEPPAEYEKSTELGHRVLREGMRGGDVRILQALLRGSRVGPGHVSGRFDGETARAVSRFQGKLQLDPDGVAGPQTTRALTDRMRVRRATWYGPGFFGRRTACGQRLTPRTVGVAHRSLPCGTAVTIAYKGRYLRTRVIDRGPFRSGYSWDLTQAAANRIGFERSDVIRSIHYVPGRARISRDGRTAIAPPDAPRQVRKAIAWANRITRKPYRYGGGHRSFSSRGYDCSGAVSYALRGAGLLKKPVDSRRFMRWGRRGKGRWITVYAHRGHAYAEIAGLRFDTSGAGERHTRGGTRVTRESGPRWRSSRRSERGYRARHWPGL